MATVGLFTFRCPPYVRNALTNKELAHETKTSLTKCGTRSRNAELAHTAIREIYLLLFLVVGSLGLSDRTGVISVRFVDGLDWNCIGLKRFQNYSYGRSMTRMILSMSVR